VTFRLPTAIRGRVPTPRERTVEGEHGFGVVIPHRAPVRAGQPQSMSGEDLTAEAADLAERILDEVSKADQDWQRIARWARELAELADTAASR
jgi:hypothetical protein